MKYFVLFIYVISAICALVANFVGIISRTEFLLSLILFNQIIKDVEKG